jgi:eukaryotic-like serine/threonine-protein kinase
MPSDLDDHARGRVGCVINKKYRLERLIGSGGMASVYEAVHRNGNRVAIKMLHPHLCINADLRARFLREGYVANRVSHQGAVRVLDDDTTEDGSVFLVMELLKGETLDARWEVRGSRLADREVCEHAHQLLDVLAAAHGQGVVHRDIKPENLFLTSDGVLKVLDFGIARLREASRPEGATQTGRMIGTPAFMPPEQALGRSRQIDGQTDLWAVGATMFTLVSGRYVHEAETMEEMLVRAGSRPARSVSSVLPGLPAPIGSIIDRALAFEKQERWPHARAMEQALEDAYHRVFATPIPGSRGSKPASALVPRIAPMPDEDERTAIMSPAHSPMSPVDLPTGTEPLPDRPRIPAGAATPLAVVVQQAVETTQRLGPQVAATAAAFLPLAETTVPMTPATIGGIAATAEGVAPPAAPKAPATAKRPAKAAIGIRVFFVLLGGSIVIAIVGGRREHAVQGAATAKSSLPSVVLPAVTLEPLSPASATPTVLELPPTVRVEDLPTAVLPVEAPAKPQPHRPRTVPAQAPNPYVEPATTARIRATGPSSAGSGPAPPPASATPQPRPNCSPPFVVDAMGKKKWKVECL